MVFLTSVRLESANTVLLLSLYSFDIDSNAGRV